MSTLHPPSRSKRRYIRRRQRAAGATNLWVTTATKDINAWSARDQLRHYNWTACIDRQVADRAAAVSGASYWVVRHTFWAQVSACGTCHRMSWRWGKGLEGAYLTMACCGREWPPVLGLLSGIHPRCQGRPISDHFWRECPPDRLRQILQVGKVTGYDPAGIELLAKAIEGLSHA